MNSTLLRIDSTARVFRQNTRQGIGLQTLLFASAIAFGFVLAAFMLSHNHTAMAVWFVAAKVIGPLSLVVLGWLCFANIFGRRRHSIAQILTRLSAAILLLLLALPIPLAVLNRLPFQQSTAQWSGEIVAQEELSSPGLGRQRTRIVVSSKDLGPHVEFDVPWLDPLFLDGSESRVRGNVTLGFMGMPINARLRQVQPALQPTR